MASVAEIDGLTVPAEIEAAAAYSVRLLDSLLGTTYTGPAMRVRRDTAGGTGDDDEADIAFDTSLTDPAISLDSAISNASAGVTATTLGQFLNVGTVNGTTYTNPDSLTVTASCFVDEWKDQSGNANHVSQAAFGSQPKIHSGTVNTDLHTVNGKLAFDTVTGAYMQTASFTMSGTNAVAIVTSLDAWTFVINGNASAYEMLIAQAGSTNTQVDALVGTPTYYVDGSTKTWTDRADVYTTLSSQRLVFADDADLSAWSLGIGMGYSLSPSVFPMSMMQEVVIWDTDQTDNRTGIETNINDYYSIY